MTSFQKHGVARALRLIRETGGAIVADEVGLGKSFIAGEVVQIYRERRQRALLICPAAVRDAVWRKFLARFQLYVECLSFEQLAADRQLRDHRRPNADSEHLKRDLDEYQLVVVDEAHNYRNSDTPTRAATLRRLLYGRRRDVLLLTATPVNNSLWDLYHLVRFFVRQDASFADRGILSIRERFHSAMREDPSNLSPDVLFPVIDATTVKRTRQFVKKHYAGDTIGGPDGQPVRSSSRNRRRSRCGTTWIASDPGSSTGSNKPWTLTAPRLSPSHGTGPPHSCCAPRTMRQRMPTPLPACFAPGS